MLGLGVLGLFRVFVLFQDVGIEERSRSPLSWTNSGSGKQPLMTRLLCIKKIKGNEIMLSTSMDKCDIKHAGVVERNFFAWRRGLRFSTFFKHILCVVR